LEAQYLRQSELVSDSNYITSLDNYYLKSLIVSLLSKNRWDPSYRQDDKIMLIFILKGALRTEESQGNQSSRLRLNWQNSLIVKMITVFRWHRCLNLCHPELVEGSCVDITIDCYSEVCLVNSRIYLLIRVLDFARNDNCLLFFIPKSIWKFTTYVNLNLFQILIILLVWIIIT